MYKRLYWVLILLVSGQNVIAAVPDVLVPDKIVLAYEPEHLNHSQSSNVTPAVQLLAEALGVPIVYYQCPWARCMKLAEAGDVDVVDHLFKTQEREAFLTFLNPPYSEYVAQFRFYALKRSQYKVKSLEDLAELSVGVVRGNVYYQQFDHANNINKLYSVSEDQLIEMVKLGRVDSFIASATLTDEMIKAWDPEGELMQLDYKHYENKSVHIAVSKDSPWQSHIKALEKQLAGIVKTLPRGVDHH